MNKTALSFILILSVFTVSFGQTAGTKNAYLELGGAHMIGGLSFDKRFSGNSGLGYKIGLGVSISNTFNVNEIYEPDSRGASIPAEINYLFGNESHFFELGAGLNLGVYNLKYNVYYLDSIESDYYEIKSEKKNVFSYNGFFNMGYRYQKISGFSFRGGFTNSFTFNDKFSKEHAFKMISPWPYLSFGYSF